MSKNIQQQAAVLDTAPSHHNPAALTTAVFDILADYAHGPKPDLKSSEFRDLLLGLAEAVIGTVLGLTGERLHSVEGYLDNWHRLIGMIFEMTYVVEKEVVNLAEVDDVVAFYTTLCIDYITDPSFEGSSYPRGGHRERPQETLTLSVTRWPAGITEGEDPAGVDEGFDKSVQP